MSGINGFTWNDTQLCQKMNDAIKHRGPDANNVFSDDNITIGYVQSQMPESFRNLLLLICDESCSIWIAYDGEIYNHLNIKGELASLGYKFKSETEAETILNAYLEWGIDCLEKFNGVWSIALITRDQTDYF